MRAARNLVYVPDNILPVHKNVLALIQSILPVYHGGYYWMNLYIGNVTC